MGTIFKSTPFATGTTAGTTSLGTTKKTAFVPEVFTSLAPITSGGSASVALGFDAAGVANTDMPPAGCASSADGWVIWARINTEASNNTYCRDSNGYQGERTLNFTADHNIDDNADVTCTAIQT